MSSHQEVEAKRGHISWLSVVANNISLYGRSGGALG